jgi:ribosomal protein S18 acetylase RimI-like enzyme
LPEVRGMGVGRELVHQWLDRLRSRRLPGCHLQKFAENSSATAFFAACGFERLPVAQPVPGLRMRTGKRLHTEVMVQKL